MSKISEPGWRHRPETVALLAALEASRIEARFVGGCVRDALMGKDAEDIDLATPMPAPEVLARLEGQGLRAVPTGLSHGTITAVIGARSFEITTLRRDVACDGRHAEVEFTDSWEQDAARRDFTYNALYMDANGTLHDYTGGQADLRARRTRFIGEPKARIREDGLRVLRYFRFLAQTGCPDYPTGRGEAAFDYPSFEACAAMAEAVEPLSGERIQAEMRKMLALPSPFMALKWMEAAGVLARVFPGAQTGVWDALPLVEEAIGLSPDPLRRIASAFPEDASEMIAHLRARWKLSNADAARLEACARTLREGALATEADAKVLLRRAGKQAFTDALYVSFARFTAAKGATPAAAAEGAGLYAPLVTLAEQWEIPVFPVTGEDLLAQGFMPGVTLGKRLKALEAQWEASGYRLTKAQLLAGP